MEVPSGHTFRPDIGNSSMILQYSPVLDANEETLDERLERLSHRDSRRRYHIRQRIAVSSSLSLPIATFSRLDHQRI